LLSPEILAGAVEIDRSVPGNVPAAAGHTLDCVERRKGFMRRQLRMNDDGFQSRRLHHVSFA
jgi:hypothetical protein